ncbi:MAG: hypothetical protein DWQ34_09100 [Planctomycetota bacterium]|nr:MAG: hypothetical protein DWQ29_10115 [Planctomycetota bacterium]REJ94224.1 MAG: hypothetical protein DWQ34_09100 [Planctomycetota bacterium]REK35342.1 MAG: hypothetical protein DWQ45_11485 [Planctomycetota bacterium]
MIDASSVVGKDQDEEGRWPAETGSDLTGGCVVWCGDWESGRLKRLAGQASKCCCPETRLRARSRGE